MFDVAANLMNTFLSPSNQAPTDRQRNPGRSGSGIGQLICSFGEPSSGSTAGGLAGLLLRGKSPRKLAHSAMRLGGVAVVGGLAYTAWQKWNATPHSAFDSPDMAAVPSQPVSAPPLLGTNFLPVTASAQDDLSRLLIKAMVSAAKADRHFNQDDQIQISTHLENSGVHTAHRIFVETQLAHPTSIDDLVAASHCPEVGSEVYMASILVIGGDTVAQRDYLGMLSSRLRLAPDLVEHLHASADAATVA